MSRWQRKARLAVAVGAVALAVVVALAFRRTPASNGGIDVRPSDPKALVESTGGVELRFTGDKEEIRIEFESGRIYAAAPSQIQGVKVTTVRAAGRTFVVTARQAEVGKGETSISLVGDVRLLASDGMEALAERATYTYTDGLLRSPGPIQFSRGRLTGTGTGLTYSKNVDVLSIHEHVVVHVAPGEGGSGAAEISSGSAEFSRPDHVIRFNGGMKVRRGNQVIEGDSGIASLTDDEQQLNAVELLGNARVTGADRSVGGLTAMRGHRINLKYRPDGETLERSTVTGNAVAQIGGDRGSSDRTISAGTLDVSLAPDGSTPTALTARDEVELTIPAGPGGPARSIQAPMLDGQGEAGRGLTRARFAGGVTFRERGGGLDRLARSETLDVTLAPGLSEIEDARFAERVRFEDGQLRAAGARARYALGQGTLELTGTEPAQRTPQVVNDRISVSASRLDITLEGPVVKATGAVKSELKPAKKDDTKTSDTRMPTMFDDDRLVAATSDEFLYDASASKATYSGRSQLWQGDTSITAGTIELNEKTGDLTASGSVSTTIPLEQEGKDKRKERVQTVASAERFQYEEASRRATYLVNAHVNGPQGDMTANRIELYLTESGKELERAEAYDAVTLRDRNRQTTGARMTYTAVDERYVVTGTPVVITDECGGKTTGRRVTFDARSDTVTVDGLQTRTQSRGGSKCP